MSAANRPLPARGSAMQENSSTRTIGTAPVPWNRPRWRTESNHAHAPAHIAAARMQDAGRVDRPSQHIPVNNAVDAIRVRPYVWNMPGRRHRNQHETLAALRNTDPKGQLHRAWQLRELLRTLLRHPLEQARGEVETLGVLGVPQPHPRDHGTRQEDSQAPARHPQDHRAGLLQRQARGVRQQDQSHHPHGLRLPPRRQPHRPDHAPMRWTRHPTTTTHDLTHENSRSLLFLYALLLKTWLQAHTNLCPCLMSRSTDQTRSCLISTSYRPKNGI